MNAKLEDLFIGRNHIYVDDIETIESQNQIENITTNEFTDYYQYCSIHKDVCKQCLCG